MKTFTMFRRNVPDATHNADQKNAPHEPQFQGVLFDDGSVAIRWMTAKRSTAVWSSMEDMLAIHGHPEYGSELIWAEPAISQTEAREALNLLRSSPRDNERSQNAIASAADLLTRVAIGA